MSDRCNPATRNIYYNQKPQMNTPMPKAANTLYRPDTMDTVSKVQSPYGFSGGQGTNLRLSGPIIDGHKIAMRQQADLAFQKSARDRMTQTRRSFASTAGPLTSAPSALPEGPLPAGWIPGGF